MDRYEVTGQLYMVTDCPEITDECYRCAGGRCYGNANAVAHRLTVEAESEGAAERVALLKIFAETNDAGDERDWYWRDGVVVVNRSAIERDQAKLAAWNAGEAISGGSAEIEVTRGSG